MSQEGATGTTRQRAVAAARERKKGMETEEARRRTEIAKAHKKNWHASRSKPSLSGTTRQRDESSTGEAGGPSKLQGTGSPTRSTGITKSPGPPHSILRNNAGKATSSRTETDNQPPSRSRNERTPRVDGTGVGVGRGEGGNAAQSLNQGSRSGTSGDGSKGVRPTTLFREGLQPKSHKAKSKQAANMDPLDTRKGESARSTPSKSPSKVAWKEAIETSEDEESRGDITPWTQKGFFYFTVELPSNIKGGAQVSAKFKEKIGSMLAVIQSIDDAACILHPKDPGTSNIRSTKDFDKMFYVWSAFFRFDKDNVFTRGTGEKARLLRGTLTLGMAKDCKMIVDSLSTDISISSGVNLYWKNLQAFDTRKKLALPCTPYKIPAAHIQEMVIELMEKSERAFVKKYPARFPSEVHTGTMPEMVVQLNWAEGTPWNDPKKRSSDDTSHRKVFQLEHKFEDQPRLVTLVKEIKKKGYEKDIFGEAAYFAFQPERNASGEHKKAWERKVKYSGTVMMNQGSVEFSGLENPDAEVQMEMIDQTLPQPGKMSVRSILSKMKGPGNKRFWQCIARNWDGIFTGTFIGHDKETLEMAAEYSACLASQLRVYLQRRGFTRECIAKLLWESFDDKRQSSASRAKWDSKRRKVIPGCTAADESLAIQGDDRFDMTLGMTTEEKADYARDQVRRAALEVDRPEGDEANMAAFRMNEDSSVAGTVAGDRSVAAYSLGAKSLFSFGPGELESLDDEMDGAAQGMPEENGGEPAFVIEMPSGGLGGVAGGDDGTMDTGSEGGRREDVSEASKDPPSIRDKAMEVEERSDQEDRPSLPCVGAKGALEDSLIGLHFFVDGQFPEYKARTSTDVIEGWENVFIMLGEFGAEIDKEIDEGTDLVLQGDNADVMVTREAEKWDAPIVGVEDTKRMICGLVDVFRILACPNRSRLEKEQALRSKEGSEGEGKQPGSALDEADSTGWNFKASEEAIDEVEDNIQTSTPTGGSQGDRTIEPPQ